MRFVHSTGTLNIKTTTASTTTTTGALVVGGGVGVAGAITGGSSITGTSFVKSGGTSAQFLKADGSVDASTYAPTASPTFTGTITAPAGTTANAPIVLQSGTALTTPQNGAIEFNGQVATLTPNASLGRTPVAMTVFTSGVGTTGSYTLNTNYPLFPSANDTITLPIGTYKVEMNFRLDIAGSTTTAILNFSMRGAGTAVGTFAGISYGQTATQQTASGYNIATGTIANAPTIAGSSAGNPRQYIATVMGVLRITTAGTIIPSYQFNATLVGATSSTLFADNYLVITPLSGSATYTNSGGWA
jgi:hypothetical protein